MITLSIIFWVFNYVDSIFITHILYSTTGIKIPGLGVLLTLALIMLVGFLGTNYLGKKLIGYGEYIMEKVPVVSSVYKTIKQIIDTIGAKDKNAFQRVVLIEYPRKGLWALAFVTGETEGEVQHKTSEELINLFLPTTPNPTSGFLLMVPREDTIPMDMTVEEGIKTIISAGVITPPYTKGTDNIGGAS